MSSDKSYALEQRVKTVVASAPVTVMTSGPQTISTTAQVNVSGLSLPLGVGRYTIDVWLAYAETAISAGNEPSFQFTYTTGTENLATQVAASGSILQGQDAGFEGGTGNWTAGSNCTLSDSAVQAHSGTDSLLVTSVAAGNMSWSAGGNGSVNELPCQPGQEIWASAWVRAATAGRTCRVQVDFRNAAKAYVTTLNGPNVTDTTTGWLEITDGSAIIAPATCYFAYINIAVLATGGAAEGHYADDVYFGASGTLQSETEGWFQRNAASDSFGGFSAVTAQPWGGPVVTGPPYSQNTILTHLRCKMITTGAGVVQLTANTSSATFTYVIQAGADMSATRYGQMAPVATSAVAPVVPTGIPGEWALVFDDEFQGTTLDTVNNWLAIPFNQAGPGLDMSVDGSGHLVLVLPSAAFSDQLVCIPYQMNVEDCVEARIYMPGSAPDVLYNHFTFWTAGPNWPAAGEVDICEVSGWVGGSGSLTYNYHDPAGQFGSTAPAGTWSNAYHIFGMHRLPSSAVVYWDGVVVATLATADNGQPQSVNLTLTAQNPGVNEMFGAPGAVLVDYVRAWRPQ